MTATRDRSGLGLQAISLRARASQAIAKARGAAGSPSHARPTTDPICRLLYAGACVVMCVRGGDMEAVSRRLWSLCNNPYLREQKVDEVFLCEAQDSLSTGSV